MQLFNVFWLTKVYHNFAFLVEYFDFAAILKLTASMTFRVHSDRGPWPLQKIICTKSVAKYKTMWVRQCVMC